jgi:hypothetical protein
MRRNGWKVSKKGTHGFLIICTLSSLKFRCVEVTDQISNNVWCNLHLHSKWDVCIIVTVQKKRIKIKNKQDIHIVFKYTYVTKSKGKGKSIPLQAFTGPEGSRRLRLSDFMTTAHEGGKVVSPTHRPPLPPENIPSTHFY